MVLTLAGTDPAAHQRVESVRLQVLADRAAFWDAITLQLQDHSQIGRSGGHDSVVLCSGRV